MVRIEQRAKFRAATGGVAETSLSEAQQALALYKKAGNLPGRLRAEYRRLAAEQAALRRVSHRLRRIEQRTGRSLSRPKDLAELCLVFEVHRHRV